MQRLWTPGSSGQVHPSISTGLHLAKRLVEKGTSREEASLDVTRSPTHGEGSPDPDPLSFRTRRGPGAHVLALCRFRKHCPCQKPEQGGSQDRQPTLGSLGSPLATPGAAGRGRRARSTAHAPAGRAGGRPRSPAPSRSPWQRARGGRGRAAAAAISAASCSSRPRRHGNRVTQLGRLPARLARVTPAARAPSSPSRTLPGARGRQGGRLMGDAY
ncbi:uncharacterized protein LOC118239114 [Cricetulus griseus]|uniref:Uncharacterized protein LOC118239114 n=1 Tax=Cricetulus griseus TaxID=10029 RepID=A0A9J7H1P3_CRIGR|nr:uncharacterized protein LOC118239114 [Cricetulus griseus]